MSEERSKEEIERLAKETARRMLTTKKAPKPKPSAKKKGGGAKSDASASVQC